MPRGDADRARRGAARPRARPGAPRAHGARRRGERAALRLADGGRARSWSLRGRGRGAARRRRPASGRACSLGSMPAGRQPLVRPQRLPSLEPTPPASALAGRASSRGAPRSRIAAVGGAALSWLALQRIGLDRIGQSSLARHARRGSLVALGADVPLDGRPRASRGTRSSRAAMPQAPLRPPTRCRAPSIGVLMSATLPARLGEPSRALIVARRIGRPRESAADRASGTIVSQTLLNVAALAILGVVMFSTVSAVREHHRALVFFAVAPLAVLLALVLVAPALLRKGGRRARAARRRWVAQGARRRRAGAPGPAGVPQPAPRRRRDGAAARGVGDPVALLLRAARRARASTTAPASAPPRLCSSR